MKCDHCLGDFQDGDKVVILRVGKVLRKSGPNEVLVPVSINDRDSKDLVYHDGKRLSSTGEWLPTKDCCPGWRF